VSFSAATMEVHGDFDPGAVKDRIRQLGYGIVDPQSLSAPDTPARRGGVYALGRYLLSTRSTLLALIAAGLLALSAPLSLLGQAGWMRGMVILLHVGIVVLVGLPIARRG
jgi:hypothetical protein